MCNFILKIFSVHFQFIFSAFSVDSLSHHFQPTLYFNFKTNPRTKVHQKVVKDMILCTSFDGFLCIWLAAKHRQLSTSPLTFVKTKEFELNRINVFSSASIFVMDFLLLKHKESSFLSAPYIPFSHDICQFDMRIVIEN